MDGDFLEIQNPWWKNPQAILHDPHLLAIKDKSYRFTPELVQTLGWGPGDIFILRGPRQVGKTTTLKLLIQRLLHESSDPENIFYLSCEAIESFRELQNELTRFLQKRKKKRTFIFLDEISFVPSWQRAVLAVANLGLTAAATLVLTGSNARDLKESSERLPGRRGKGKDLQLYPLSLWELAKLPAFQDLSSHDLFDLYLQIGGFPRAVAEYVTLGTVTDDTYGVYRNWIVGDASRYQLRQETLKQMLFRIGETLTSQITWPKLIENSPVRSHETALEYVEHLQDAFLCHIHYCYRPETKGPALQKARKLYFVDPLLYGIAFSWREGTSNVFRWMKSLLEESEFRGKLFESVAVNHAARLHPQVYYWYSAKEKKEVDLLIPAGEPRRPPRLFEIKLAETASFRALGEEVDILTPGSFLEKLGKL
ncbi:MAG TPA: hypothetical protein DF383_08965 [Deltaproteobacteria bacterium]|nr:hypothetical protein [Deltaproteobacteria bacterium]